jgi:hypothetical protein
MEETGGTITKTISRPAHVVMVVLVEKTSVQVVMLMAVMGVMAIVVTIFVAPWGALEERP